ncbi:MAG: hypothetical protein ACK41T_01160 [Pseudobdellovibrio sp.]
MRRGRDLYKTAFTNNHGQALIEGLFTTALAIISITVGLNYAFNVLFSIVLDSVAENFLICRITPQTNCEQQLKQSLSRQRFKKFNYQINEDDKKISVVITIQHMVELKLKRELNYESYKKTF